jgi:hypothetical protein
LEHGNKSSEQARSLHVTTKATHKRHGDVISALSWVCAAIRGSKHTTVAHSSTLVEAELPASGEKSVCLKLRDLDPIRSSGKACWHTIFPYAVIASGFPIHERVEGKGLDISFADMLLMSRSLNFTEYDRGLIVEGLRSLLMPVSELRNDDAIQWHYMDRINQTTLRSDRNSHLMTAHKVSSWHRALDPHLLIGRHYFLGWAEEVNVAMGTKPYSTTNIKQLDAKSAPTKGSIRSYGITLGTDDLRGFGTATGTATWTKISIPSHITLPLNKDIHDFLADGTETHILCYDSIAKTG